MADVPTAPPPWPKMRYLNADWANPTADVTLMLMNDETGAAATFKLGAEDASRLRQELQLLERFHGLEEMVTIDINLEAAIPPIGKVEGHMDNARGMAIDHVVEVKEDCVEVWMRVSPSVTAPVCSIIRPAS